MYGYVRNEYESTLYPIVAFQKGRLATPSPLCFHRTRIQGIKEQALKVKEITDMAENKRGFGLYFNFDRLLVD
jgi:hypothetical protein